MRPPALFLAADTPWPPDGGGRIATLRVLESMVRERPVDLLALADPEQPIDLRYLRSICRRVELVELPFTFGRHRGRQLAVALRSLPSPDPYRLRKFRSRIFARRVRELKRVSRYEFVHHDQFGVAPYVDSQYPTTLTTQNVESEIYRLGAQRATGLLRRAWAALEAGKLRRAEPRLCRQFDAVFVLSDHDARLLEGLGVDDARVLPIPIDAPPSPPSGPPPGARVLTIGSMSWFGVEDGLLWLHREVMPRVRAAVPETTWDLVGPNAGSRIREIADGRSLILHGYLPDVEPILARSRVCLVPLQVAGGIRIKVIEMLARGIPCVATTVGAQGLSFADGEGCFRRDDPAGFADAVVRLLRDDQLWRETARRGWQYVRKTHTRAGMATALEEGIQHALRSHADKGGELGS
ncbi:MAG: glycosyltransferase family 4 protein, partial [Candidatus Limnocylindria bacterium]